MSVWKNYQIVYKSSRGHDGRMIYLEKLENEHVDSDGRDDKI